MLYNKTIIRKGQDIFHKAHPHTELPHIIGASTQKTHLGKTKNVESTRVEMEEPFIQRIRLNRKGGTVHWIRKFERAYRLKSDRYALSRYVRLVPSVKCCLSRRGLSPASTGKDAHKPPGHHEKGAAAKEPAS